MSKICLAGRELSIGGRHTLSRSPACPFPRAVSDFTVPASHRGILGSSRSRQGSVDAAHDDHPAFQFYEVIDSAMVSSPNPSLCFDRHRRDRLPLVPCAGNDAPVHVAPLVPAHAPAVSPRLATVPAGARQEHLRCVEVMDTRKGLGRPVPMALGRNSAHKCGSFHQLLVDRCGPCMTGLGAGMRSSGEMAQVITCNTRRLSRGPKGF
ncbi:hypothetical protein BD414DRAFT_103122 [Trametes punicea]|nr:hypothetical protein BD414DRAFT_103122 [Trametes punicea]